MNQPGATPNNRWVSTQLTGTGRTRLITYLTVIAGAGLCFSALVLNRNSLPDLGTTAVFTILGIIGFNQRINLPSKAQLHATWPLLVAALYCHGLPLAILAGVPGMVSQAVFGSSAWLNSLFNGGQLAVSLGLASITTAIVSSFTPETLAYEIVALICGMTAFDLCNIALVSLAVAMEQQERWRLCFSRMFFRDRRNLLPLLYLLTLAGALLCSFIGNIGLVIIFAHVFAVWHLMRFQQELDIRTEESRTDPLTKAFNYRYLEDWLHSEFPKVVGEGKPCSFIFIDLDGLKHINDTSGHEAGDAILVNVTQALFSTAREQDVIIRYGGDEFIIICPSTDHETAAMLGQRLIGIFSSPICYQNAAFKIGLSVGIAAYPEDSDIGRDLIRLADWAMYHAKKSGGNSVCKARDL